MGLPAGHSGSVGGAAGSSSDIGGRAGRRAGAPFCSRAYSRVSSQVTLWGSCLAKKSSAAQHRREGGKSWHVWWQAVGGALEQYQHLAQSAGENGPVSPRPTPEHPPPTYAVGPAVADQCAQVRGQVGKGGADLAALARPPAKEGNCRQQEQGARSSTAQVMCLCYPYSRA
jgi:hypothetical protein